MEYKQDMPPPGGYPAISYKRVPIKRSINGVGVFGIGCVITAYGWFRLFQERDKMNNENIEMRCSRIALRPMLEAENDRALLKQLKRNRDAEERIMKDVEGWEVGKWQGCPVYLSLHPDEYFLPAGAEMSAHADPKIIRKAYTITKDV